MTIKRIAVVMAFMVSGIVYVSGNDGETVVIEKKTPDTAGAEENTPAQNKDGNKENGAGRDSIGAVSEKKTDNDPELNGKGGDESLTRASDKININTAGESELTTLKGIGPAKAHKIIDFRTVNGKFNSIEELMLVPGIKEGTFSKIKDLITVI
ncbi:MAG: helix-hairpin-helix domain-containing protein [Lachnospiraceae bacterium]|nr:helix-hairpin-helix domain-containing protein [Lachnospiraceae bacterium]